MLRRLATQLMCDALAVGKFVAIVAIPVALLLTHVGYQYQVTRLGYEISEETRRHERLQNRHRKLRIEYAVESRSERITEVARRDYGMQRLEPDQIVRVEEANPPERRAVSQRGHASLGSMRSGTR